MKTTPTQFEAWFGSSLVTDTGKAGGNPLVVFHGTKKPVDTFSGAAQFFTADPDYAAQYANTAKFSIPADVGGGNIMPVYLALKNPKVMENHDEYWAAIHKNAESKLLDKYREAGHDGIIVRGFMDNLSPADMFITFSPGQIKSVFNNGDFDPNNLDVRFSVAEDPRTAFQERVLAAQELADQVRSTGQRLAINADGTVTLFHSTSSANAEAIQSEGQFKGNTWFSSSRSATLGHAKPKHGSDTTTISITIDPRQIEFSTGTGEFYAPDGLKRNEEGLWAPAPPIQNETAQEVIGVGLLNWSSNSKIRTEAGDLQVVYHGTTRSFTKFSEKLLGSKTGALDAKTGFFFAENPKAADMFTWEDGSPYGGNILPVYLNIANPFIVKDLVLDGASGTRVGRIMEIAKASGHDGVIFERSNMLGQEGKSFAVFNPEQIKSAIGNRGTYSPNNSDLRYSVAQPAERSRLSSAEHFDGTLELPGGVHADIVAERDKFASIYSWSSSRTGASDTRRALRELRSFGRRVVVHDPGAPDSQSFSYWRAMASEGLVDQVFDVNDQDITEQLRVAPRPPASSSAFDAWFGASAVRDPLGAPLPVYHGTGADTGSSFLPGSFFTALPYVAGIYATAPTRQTDGAGPNLTPVFLSLQKPYVFDAKDIRDNLSHHVLGRRGSIADVIAKLKADGHDGMLLKNYDDLGGMQDQYVIFDPKQAKSAIGNGGAYSPVTEDIRFSFAQTQPAPQSPGAALLPPARPLDRLNKVMHQAGWEIEYIEMDLTANKPKLELRVNRDDGRFIIAKVDSFGRANFETFHRERQLKMDGSTKGRRPLTPTVDDTFLGRKRFEGARSMLRGMVTYLADNAARPTALPDLRAAWAGVMSNPVRQVVALQDKKKSPAQTAAFKQWFDDSQATVDGKPGSAPIVAYHGTNQDFTAFDRTRLGQNTAAASSIAFFFSESPAEAAEYAQLAGRTQIANAVWTEARGEELKAQIAAAEARQDWPTAERLYLEFENLELGAINADPSGQNVMPVFLKVRKPKILDMEGHFDGHLIAEAITTAQRDGHDGLKLLNAYDPVERREGGFTTTQWVIFSPGQVKSAMGNIGTFDPESKDIRFSMRPAAGDAAASSQWWRSSLRDGVSDLPMAQAPAQGWKDAIQGLLNKGKVKPSEVEWSGITDWLEIQTGRVSKDDLLDVLDTQGLQLQETITGQAAQGPAVRYENQQLLGGENYRELLLTLPVKPTLDIKLAESRFRLWSGESRDFLRGEDGKLALGYETLAEAQAAAAKIGGPLAGNFHSNHWPEHPNVLAHIRFNTRVDAAGARTLFVEEIQSDWAQLGRKQGLRLSPGQIKALEPGSPEAIMAIAGGDLGRMSVEVAIGDGMGTMVQTLSPESKDTRFPSGPFIGTTDAWVALCIKRLISYAATEGFDKVAFITGEQSVERYRLDKRLQRVNVMKMGDKYQVFGTDHHGDSSNYGVLTLVEIERLLGKDLAEKIARQEYPNEVYQGNDLIVGGKGMREFYDRIVPQVATEVLRKLGVGQIGNVRIGGVATYEQLQAAGKATGLTQMELDAMPRDEHKALIDSKLPPQPSFDITPAMREMVSRGLPLFSFAGSRARTADASRLVAEDRIARGATAEAARQETGWHQGIDKKWRFEISDDKARLLPVIKSLRQGGYSAKEISTATYRYNEEDGTYDLTLNPTSPQKTTDFVCLYRALPEVLDALLPQEVYAQILQGAGTEDYINDFQDARRIKAEFKFEGMNALPLDQVLEHPELFKAYPALQNVMVQVHPKLGNDGTCGLMDDGTRVIGIGVGQQLDALLHEIQHIIQDIESFAMGTMPSTVGIEAYRRAAGEVEARNTTTRRRMTAEERLASAPASTQDVPAEQVLIRPQSPANDIGRVRQAIAELLRVPGPELPTGRGKIVVVGSDYIPGGWMPLSASLSRLGEAGGNGDLQVETAIARTLRQKAQAFFDPVTRTTGLIADRILPGTEAGVFLHEMTHKHGRNALAPGAWNTIITTLKGWENAPARTIESKIFHRARDRAVSQNPGVSPDVLDEELFAYAVEDCYKRGVRPSALAADTSAEKWLDLVVTSLYQMTERLIGAPAPEMTAQDIVDLAYALAQLETPEIAARINEALQVMNDKLDLDPVPGESTAENGPLTQDHTFSPSA